MLKSNKKLLFLISSLFFTTFSIAQDLSLPKKLKVLDVELVIKENSGDKKKGMIAEYIPERETFDNWTQLFATRFLYDKSLDPKTTANSLAKVIAKRKEEGDIFANSMVMQSPDGKSVAIDFLASSDSYIEHNVWRYFKTPDGLASFQIARRNYSKANDGSSRTEFIKSIQTKRASILNELLRKDLPVIKSKE